MMIDDDKQGDSHQREMENKKRTVRMPSRAYPPNALHG